MKQLGWDFSQLQDLAILELTCVVVYLIPWTSVTGAILMTGYMGGAMATHLRVHEPPVVQMIVPIVAWLGLWLREPRLRAILPWRG